MFTDGLAEPEDARGEAFGDARLGAVLRDHHGEAAPALCRRLLAEAEAWRPAGSPRQDDVTLLVIEVA